MILGLLLATNISAQSPPAVAPDPYIAEDAAHAIDAGRLQEAKLLIARAAASGVNGERLIRLNANLAFASGQYAAALGGFQQLATAAKQQSDCEKGLISALKLGRFAEASAFADCAVAGTASWRAWNARGVLADASGDWTTADDAFARARELAPNEASIVNNQGWSRLLRGDWAGAIPLLQQASALDPKSERVANNLQLAADALHANLPQRQPGESEADWAARLNDAGVAAQLLGDRKRAVAAFTEALDASPTWYGRASNNLKQMSAD